MRKLSKINEGMFKASIQRSNSNRVRKEDNVNVNKLNCYDFLDYLNIHYNFEIEPEITGDETIKIRVIHESGYFYSMYIIFENDVINRINIFCNKDKLIRYISDKYQLSQTNTGITKVNENGEISNQICLDIIDEIISNSINPIIIKKDNINEGMFKASIQRSNSNKVRKEDNINQFKMNDFFDYINDNYNVAQSKISKYAHNISIPFAFINGVGFNNMSIYFDIYYEERRGFADVISIPRLIIDDIYKDKFTNLRKVLKEKYIMIDNERSGIIVEPFDHQEGDKIKNTFIIDVINTIIENIDDKTMLIISKK